MKIGILGAGQLGRMMALAGIPLGHDFVLYDLSGSPSAGIGELISDPEGERLDEFLAKVDVVTYEFEHLPLELTGRIAQRKPLMPGLEALRVCQNRELEKRLFADLGIPTPEWRVATDPDSLAAACHELGCPLVAKSITEGYDGKGQALVRDPDEAQAAWDAIGHDRLVVERFVNFERELSIIAVRGQDGQTVIYPMAENVHNQGILRYSIAPAPSLSAETVAEAEGYIRSLLNALDYVGVLALELFQTPSGLLANEMAPRVHNSGHWTQEGATISQFENHVRAITGLPLGDVNALGPTCMINLIGRTGAATDILQLPYTHLHLYGKAERPGRKLGHINIRADSYRELVWRVRNCIEFVPGVAPFDSTLTEG